MLRYIINKARKMKTKNDNKIDVIGKVLLCDNAQLQKVNEYISSLWREEEEKEEQFKKDYAEWKEKKEDSIRKMPAS
jgi:proline dehydrogenase